MALAIFDLDNTLLAGDSDFLWGEYMMENNLVDPVWFKRQNDRFYADYVNGELDIYLWLKAQLKPLTETSLDKLLSHRQNFIDSVIKPIILDKGLDTIDKHRTSGDTLLIITATNSFITRPIADILDIEHLLAAEFEVRNGKYTGNIIGTPTFKEGKVARLNEWLDQNKQNMAGSFFYSDSHNDIPLLKMVAQPIAVDPDPELKDYALINNWEIISFR